MPEFLRAQDKKYHAHHEDGRGTAAGALPPETSGVSSQTIACVRIVDSRDCARASVPAASTRTASIAVPGNQTTRRASCFQLRRQWKHLYRAWAQRKLRAPLRRYSSAIPKDHREAFHFPASALRDIDRQTSRDTRHKAPKIPGIAAPPAPPARQELLAKRPPVPDVPRQP